MLHVCRYVLEAGLDSANPFYNSGAFLSTQTLPLQGWLLLLDSEFLLSLTSWGLLIVIDSRSHNFRPVPNSLELAHCYFGPCPFIFFLTHPHSCRVNCHLLLANSVIRSIIMKLTSPAPIPLLFSHLLHGKSAAISVLPSPHS